MPRKVKRVSREQPRVRPAGESSGENPYAEILLDVAHRVAEGESLDEQLRSLVEIATQVIGADRGTLFLNDPETHELYSRVAQGNLKREIRVLNHTGIAGHVFSSGKGEIVEDAYSDRRFNRSVDQQTGYRTRNIICAPIKTVRGEVIGAIEVLNKKRGPFISEDLELLEAMATSAAAFLQRSIFMEKTEKERRRESEFMSVVSEVSTEIQLGALLQKIMATVTKMLNAERSTLFVNDEKTSELYTEIGEGLGATTIRFPNRLGIAGAVFTSGQSVNIPHAYADLRFNPEFDKKTGFFTRSILCTPVVNKDGKIIGVTQVLNKRGGPFAGGDEARLKAFTAQVAIALENAKLFDEVQNMKNYNEAMLESMSNAVITVDEEGKIVTCNTAGLRITRAGPSEILRKPAVEFFTGKNSWILERQKQVEQAGKLDVVMDAEMEFGGEKVSVNATTLPLINVKQKKLGTMVMLEDISEEKRVKSTMARYMDPAIADQLLASGQDVLGGLSSTVTILFSDIRSFTTLTEQLGAQGTVGLLNEYFTLMVDCIQREGGMLDKFIGDAIMAAFGVPVAKGEDEDRAVRAAVAMICELTLFNKARVSRGLKPVDIGIGINTDEVVSGNIGSPKRMNYTIIGDGVNLASRLEAANKQYHTRILVSEFTYKKLKGTYRSREVDQVVVQGKTEPVVVYEVLDYHTEESFPNLMEALNQFKHGLAEYRKQRWDLAAGAFHEALRLNPADKVSEMYAERCDYFKAHPPGDDWDGVWVMKSK
ncbi:MAG: GAF domain-containing protein [Deltaproteobacteria bacterium]|nr:GAF domain-containing protein [Deltaproteobacteria bacterium]